MAKIPALAPIVAGAMLACSAPNAGPGAWEHRTIAVGDGDSLHLVQRGLTQSKVLVFIPGFADTWESYRSLAAALPDTFGMVLIDALGHGRSTKRPGASVAPRQSAALAAALDSLDVRPFAIIGHSYGGIIAQHYGAAHPDLAAAVIMASSTTMGTNPAAAAFDSLARAMPDSVPDEVLAMQADGFFGPVPDSVLLPAIAASRATPGHVWREVIPYIITTDTRELLRQWTPRTLLVMAENDKVMGPGPMEDLVRAIPSADTVRIPRTSHAMHWERPDTVAAVITAFLERAARP